jgi:hypothetical protein
MNVKSDIKERAPEFVLTTVQGARLSLGELLQEKCAILFVFLRHLG